ncbi:hypothetical protein [Pantoea cypripedii]|uniref:hypothetical protein n=1 Tax=Pantoea cypripedii TaxID=55209 RepID=UPI003B8455FA
MRLWGEFLIPSHREDSKKIDVLARPFYVIDNKPVPDIRMSEGGCYVTFLIGIDKLKYLSLSITAYAGLKKE